ncbi:MAG: TrkH family potassium uptake protein [Hyphomicrobiaceae bacterium]
MTAWTWRKRVKRRVSQLRLSPPTILIGGYALLVATGAALLKLPPMLTAPLNWTDAIFTSASAVTVTGLGVVDTGQHFTIYGQAVLMVLIQLGGLGLMTTAVFVFALLGVKMPIRHQLILSDDLNHNNLGGLLELAAAILKIVVVIEVIGTVLLSIRFVPEMGLAHGLWSALFHSISAFNNAGFSLYSDSLARWVGDPLINLTIPMLFVIGGLGFTVIVDLYSKRSWHSLTLHSKLMLAGTAGLIFWSVSGFMILEWTNHETLAGLPHLSDKFFASWFQALTTRTAGFATLDIAKLRDSTTLLLISLMLIGGGPTSTAGGLKVTTFVVLLLATYSFLKRKEQISVFSRSIPADQILKVLALVTLSLMILLTATFMVLAFSHKPFLDVLFEVSSAFGTVGLSRNFTSELDPVSRLVIVAVMFIGRVGPLLLGFFIATTHRSRVRYPTAEINLG